MNKRFYLTVKRIFDIFVSLFGMIISAPLWLLAVVGIELSDFGPVFYVATRIGMGNKEFKMYKFRSMRQGKANETVFRGDENRIFPFGKLIRVSKIDELPQLINIFNGTMSIVGPRPAAPDQMHITRSGEAAIAGNVKAGLTGPSALYDYIYGDTIENQDEYIEKVLPNRLVLDVWYVKNMSLSVDIKMIFYTAFAVVATILHIYPRKIFNEIVGYIKQ